MLDCIIIGGGPCGVSASIYANRLGLKTLLLFEELGGQLNYCQHIHSLPSASSIRSNEVVNIYRDKISNHNIVNDRVIELIREGDIFFIKTLKNKEFKTKTIILATGGSPRIPHINIDDSVKKISFKSYPYSNIKSIDNLLIIGGGYMALEVISKISHKVKSINVIEKSGLIGGNFCRREKVSHFNNVNFYTNSTVESIVSNTAIIKREDKNMSIQNIEAVFFAIGISPNEIKSNFNLDKTEKGLSVNKNYPAKTVNMTNIKGLFAGGDVVDLPINGYVSMAESMGIECAKAVYLYLKK